MPIVMIFCFVGAYSVRSSLFDVVILIVFGIIGYLLRKAKMEPSPLVLGVILGPVLENSFSQSTLIFGGDLTMFFTRPISGTLLAIGILVTIWPLIKKLVQKGRRV